MISLRPLVAVSLGAFALVAAACSGDQPSTAVQPSTSPIATAAGATAASAPAGSCPADSGLTGAIQDHGSAAASGPAIALDVGDFYFAPTCTLSTPRGTAIVTLHNSGQILHNISVSAQNIDVDLEPGETVTVEVAVGAAPIAFLCKYHRSAGMVGAFLPAAG